MCFLPCCICAAQLCVAGNFCHSQTSLCTISNSFLQSLYVERLLCSFYSCVYSRFILYLLSSIIYILYATHCLPPVLHSCWSRSSWSMVSVQWEGPFLGLVPCRNWNESQGLPFQLWLRGCWGLPLNWRTLLASMRRSV